MPSVVAVIPALNEEQGLPRVINGLNKQGIQEIVVIDNGSTDRTAEIARKAGARVLFQPIRGKGNAFRKFLEIYPIKEDAFYVMLDGDATYDSSDVPRLVVELEKHDVVTGRRTTIRYNVRDLVHFLGNKLISLVGLLLYFCWNPDICTGYWAFRGSALKRIRIDATRFDLEANLFAQACKKGLSTGRVDIEYHPRVGEGKLKARDALHIIARLFRERLSG